MKFKLFMIALIGFIVVGALIMSLNNKTEASGDMNVTYTSMGVPNIDSSFKTYMSYKAITNKQSAQWKWINAWGWCDNQGFMRCNGERDLGIPDDYYLIALGSYYGTAIGSKYKITLEDRKSVV